MNRYYTELLRHCLNSLGKEGYSIKWSVKPAASEGGDDDAEPETATEEQIAGAILELERSPRSTTARSTTNFVDIEPVENS
ncbi:MAG TPA: hypothetical protein DEP46_01870, partial [Blastocatellia bacterium]|nr:hypothetical protein [Blastocatellia bacterium]